MSFVERFIILCPYLRVSTIRGSTVIPHNYYYCISCTCTCILTSYMYMYKKGYQSIHVNTNPHSYLYFVSTVKHSWDSMVQSIQDHISSLNWNYRTQLRDKNITYKPGLGEFVDANTVKVIVMCVCRIKFYIISTLASSGFVFCISYYMIFFVDKTVCVCF